MWTDHRFISFDKTPIFYRRRHLPIQIKASLILVHGMGEHGGRYVHAAEYMADHGIETIIPDLRGFGQSGGRRACIESFKDFHSDLLALHALINRNNKEAAIFLMGHSLGGLIVSSYAALTSPPRTHGIILSSPLFGIALPVPSWRHTLGIATSYLWPNYTQNNRVKPETLTHDQEILRRYPLDRLIEHNISARLYREMTRMVSRKEEIAKSLAGPVLIQQAGEDRVVSVSATENFFSRLNSQKKELIIYPGFYHEILNEIGREAVLKKIPEFIFENIEPK